MSQQTTLTTYEPDLSVLTDAEREAYEAVERGETGPRELARETNRSPGTISNLLRRARRKVREDVAR